MQHLLISSSENAFYGVTIYTADTNLLSFKLQIQQVPAECPSVPSPGLGAATRSGLTSETRDGGFECHLFVD